MERMELSEHIIRDKDMVIAYYPVNNLVKLVESDMYNKIGVELSIHLDTFNLYDGGYYDFFIKGYDFLTESVINRIISHYGNPDTSYSEFTAGILQSIYGDCVLTDCYDKYNRRSSEEGLLIPVYFKKGKFDEFVKGLMYGGVY